MEAKLIVVLREMDNNNFTKELGRYFKNMELLINPQREMLIKTGSILFFIDHINQDLDLKTVTLLEYVDIHYRKNRDNEGFEKEKKLLLKDGWKEL